MFPTGNVVEQLEFRHWYVSATMITAGIPEALVNLTAGSGECESVVLVIHQALLKLVNKLLKLVENGRGQK
ncbi:MAG: hypothetical protein JKX76_07365 [Colwellia sp.]|nr:hypothetical protein [Colwellia sp.]